MSLQPCVGGIWTTQNEQWQRHTAKSCVNAHTTHAYTLSHKITTV